jgi:hypothetical protein
VNGLSECRVWAGMMRSGQSPRRHRPEGSRHFVCWRSTPLTRSLCRREGFGLGVARGGPTGTRPLRPANRKTARSCEEFARPIHSAEPKRVDTSPRLSETTGTVPAGPKRTRRTVRVRRDSSWTAQTAPERGA